MDSVGKRNVLWLCEKLYSYFYKRDNKLWVFGEWFGNKCCDNSLFLANYISDNYPEIQCVWISKKATDLSLLSKKTKYVEKDSAESKEILKHAGVAIYNQSLADFSENMNMYCSGAITINLWHGVPWKKIGLDTFSNDNNLRKIYAGYVLKLHRPSAYLSVSSDFTKILKSANFAREKGIIKSGYPRNSIFYNKQSVQEARNKMLNVIKSKFGVKIDDSIKLITYMPTFRDKTNNVFSFEQIASDKRLEGVLDEHNAIIVQKAHFINDSNNPSKKSQSSKRILALNDVAAQELLAATDILITDYSSGFFDFLVLNRPIIHYLYDYDYYANKDRGLYYRKEDVVCGDAPETVDELIKFIDDNLRNPDKYVTLRKKRKEQYVTYESQDSCEIIYREIQKRLK